MPARCQEDASQTSQNDLLEKLAAKHEYEELTEGVWFDPMKPNGWVQKKLYDIGCSNEDKCQGCNKDECTERHRLYQCPWWKEVRRQISQELTNWGARSKNFKERLEVTEWSRDANSE